MNYRYKVSLIYISAWTLAFLFCTFSVQSKDKPQSKTSFFTFLTSISDTVPPSLKRPGLKVLSSKPNSDTIPELLNNKRNKSDSIITNPDTIDLKISKEGLDAVIEYTADDSMILQVPTKKITLYGKKTNTIYQDNSLSAPVIEFDQATGDISAFIKRDSLGKAIALPTLKQADFTSQSDFIKFNIRSQKGLTKSTYTKQGEMYVYGEVIKKISNDIIFAKRARFTTCDLDTPHFAFISNRIKFINKKFAVSGPVHPEFEGVPVPIYLPFGIYPLNQVRHSGFLAPQFTSNQQLGLGLEGIGYYKVFGDYWDLILRGNLYSYGGWTLNINPRYTKKYHYNGNLAFNIQNTHYNFRTDPDFQKNKSYQISWSHTADSKARPGVNFSARVNAASSSFNSNVPDNPYKNIDNQLQSSINYSKTGTLEGFGDWWKDKTYNLTVAANHDQNTNNKIINVNLPDVGFTLSTIYPFRKSEGAGTPKWFENLGIGYNGSGKSRFSFYDTAANIFKQIKDTLQYGARHAIPITLSLPPVGALQFAPSITYDETWFQTRTTKMWNPVTQKLDTTYNNGFYTARDMSFGVGVSTRIFGIIASRNKNSKIQAIRHEITPTLGFSYHPNFNKRNYYFAQTDVAGTLREFSYYDERNIYFPYASNSSGSITLGINNNIQMKVKNKKDTANGGLKKISILDGLTFNTSYDLFADSFALSLFSINATTNLFNKVNLTAGATLDPYDVNTNGQRIDKLLWKRKPLSLGRLLSGNVSMSTQFSGGNKTNSKSQTNRNTYNYQRSGYSADEYQNEMLFIRNNPGEYADFNIPWSVNLSYSLTLNRFFNPGIAKFKTTAEQNITFGGTLNITPKWQIGLNSYYNISRAELGLIPISISREMHCWQMSINVSPVGRYRSFSINISPKSGLLRDLRINRTRSFVDL